MGSESHKHSLPNKALVGGKDSDGSNIYVGRAIHSGVKLPAKAIPSKRACYVSFNGLEILVERFEVSDKESHFKKELNIHESFLKLMKNFDTVASLAYKRGFKDDVEGNFLKMFMLSIQNVII